MSRRNKRGHRADATGRTIGERYVRLPHWILKSPAWKALSPAAFKLLVALWSRHNGANNGEISYSVREAEEIGLHKNTATRAFNELVTLGFLKVRGDSAFSMKGSIARTWELTAEPYNDQPATKEFMAWRLAETAASNASAKLRKSVSRSPHRDTLSFYRDEAAHGEAKKDACVPSQGRKPIKSPESASLHGATSNLPCRGDEHATGKPCSHR